MGNRPHLRLDRVHSTLDDLQVTWDGTATDIDPVADGHLHAARFHCLAPNQVESTWTFWDEGKESHATTFTLARASPPPAEPAPETPPAEKPADATPPAEDPSKSK